MNCGARILKHVIGWFLLSAAIASASETTRYTVSLENPAEHLVHVTVSLAPGAAQRDLQLPVWNALYQVRDFAQYVNWVRAKDAAGRPLSVRNLNKSLWRIEGAESGGEVQYEIVADRPGPYSAELNPEHAFFNLAEILMYPVDARSAPVEIRFSGIPVAWHIATTMPGCTAVQSCVTAANYDQLVDAPVEIGSFAESDFGQGGGHYHVVVDADRADYNMQTIIAQVRRIVTAATEWMDDRPFDTYLFIYHFPHESVYGGMEHAFSTAITLNAQTLRNNPDELADVTAHEFFHLWNVKRIRPQSLEPVDYTRENYCDALWFSEGVTSTVSSYILLQAGLLDEAQYVRRLASAITTLQSRPAHLTQSAEESSTNAWLEKYPYYNLPERSISYYNKGELLGVILDLAMRDASNNRASLRDLFQFMNRNFPQRGRFFADSEGVRQSAEQLAGISFENFFKNYVAGTAEVPWNDFFRTVGLNLVQRRIQVAAPGFSAGRSFDTLPVVQSVQAGSEAERSGLQTGDTIVQINGVSPGPRIQQQLETLRPGDRLRLKVRNDQGDREIEWTVGRAEAVEFELKDVENMTPQQKARRAAWLKGEGESRH